MIRVHSTLASINGYKVRLLLALLEVPYELVELDMYSGEHKREPFLTLNPFGQMPALTDGAFTIADSHACLVYVARKHDQIGRAHVASMEVVDVLNMYTGEHKREPFLTLNPFGQMPALTDGAFTIADSHACLVYVARKHDLEGRWLPSDAEGEAKVAEWLSKSANEVHQGPWMKRAKIRRPDAIKLSDAEIDARCDHILKLMDAHLAKRTWLALDRPTIADVSCFGPISMLKVKFMSGGYIGMIEEWFVARLQPGDTFSTGGYILEFVMIKDMTVLVRRSKAKRAIIPSWGGGRMPLSANLGKIGRAHV